ncbi:hypothetical protein BCV69DRAFT_151264 [Microstroma glucosiphilum]|uniref:Uncharacterized protein n=1 Tax=Pseudomicrostroma glucosiphilum TaxID=1684307 RepID=A0A316UBQ6_9BASI|nr:hypothetical protein BCV69DRAFT_151264 [Pseudomicrostroma glucosiphilum]PWN22599.1 hypothetical protein BCV69DRAFT_151264 [Pseudomicrostroma glucosiphilum]
MATSATTMHLLNEYYGPFAFAGPGWAQALLPIPPQVRELAILEEQRRAGGSCEIFLRLPSEVWTLIAQELCWMGTTATNGSAALASTSKFFHHLATPVLYSSPILRGPAALKSLVTTLRSTSRPYSPFSDLHSPKASYVHSLSLQDLSAPDWLIAQELGHLLVSSAPTLTSAAEVRRGRPLHRRRTSRERMQVSQLRRYPLQTLSVECAGRDLTNAMPFFQQLDVLEAFEWNTAPCWLIRPAELFTALLLSWRSMHTLSLSGFRWDETFLTSVLGHGSLRKLHLGGRTMSSLREETLRGLLLAVADRPEDPADAEDDTFEYEQGDHSYGQWDDEDEPMASYSDSGSATSMSSSPVGSLSSSVSSLSFGGRSDDGSSSRERRSVGTHTAITPMGIALPLVSLPPKVRLRLDELILADLPPGKGTTFTSIADEQEELLSRSGLERWRVPQAEWGMPASTQSSPEEAPQRPSPYPIQAPASGQGERGRASWQYEIRDYGQQQEGRGWMKWSRSSLSVERGSTGSSRRSRGACW